MSYTEADLSKEDKESLMLNVQNSVYANIKKIIG